MRDLTGKTFVLTGRFKKSRDEVRNLIYKAGGTCDGRVTQAIDYLVVGKSPGAKYVTAKNLGVEIITEEEFEAFLDGQEIVREQVVASSADELLGEVRSVMQGPPTSEMWHLLVSLIDTCQEEDVPMLARYIDDYIARWSDEQMRDQQGTAGHDDIRDAYAHTVFGGSRGGIVGELRVAPDDWVGQLQQGVESPKFELIRALDLRMSKLNATIVDKILKHPQLTHLEHVELPEFMMLSSTLVKTLSTHPNTARLHRLKLGKIDAKGVGGFEKHATRAGALRVLDLSVLSVPYSFKQHGDPLAFLEVPWLASVRHLIVDLRWVDKILTRLEQVNHAIEHVSVGGNPRHVAGAIERILNHSFLRGQSVRVVGAAYGEICGDAPMSTLFAALRVDGVELERLLWPHIELPNEEARAIWEEAWEEHAGSLKLLSNLKVLEIGDAATPRVRALLAEHYPELEVL